jgi:hypothetical protein
VAGGDTGVFGVTMGVAPWGGVVRVHFLGLGRPEEVFFRLLLQLRRVVGGAVDGGSPSGAGGGLRVRVRVFGVEVRGFGGLSMATGPRGRFGGGFWTSSGGGVWVEQRAAAPPPTGVVAEAGWAKYVAGASW